MKAIFSPGPPCDILQLPPPPPGQRIAYGDDPNQFGELRLPDSKPPHPVIIFLHGGFWRAAYDLTHASHLCAVIAQAGYAVWSLEYRRVGQPGGGFPGTLDDVCAGVRHIVHFPGLDMNRVVVAGHSAGGQLALCIAARPPIALQGVVALAAVSDLQRAHSLNLGNGAVENFIGCPPHHCQDRYLVASPSELLPIQVPQLLLHGTVDDTVPFELSQAFAAASPNAQLIPLPGAGHLELIDPRSEYWPLVLENITKPLSVI